MTIRAFRDYPIKRKLIIITVMTSAIALLLGGAVFAFYEQREIRHSMARDFAVIADMFDDNVAPGLAFNDPRAMEQTLSTLVAHRHIVAAGVYDRNGQVLARYQRPGAAGQFAFPQMQRTSQRFFADRLDTFQDIVLAGENIGEVYVAADLDDLHARMWNYAFTIAGLLLACSLAALVLASRLQEIISRPIIGLARTAATVASEKNYSVRAVKEGDDEVGRLIDGFNEMLRQIQVRDTELKHAQDGLERRVAERTLELQGEIAERKEAEAALRGSEERFSSAFENASIGMALVSLEGRWLKVNRALCELVGYSSDELAAKTFQDITHPDDLAADLDYVRKVIAGDISSYQMEKRYLHKLGQVVWILLSVSLVRDAAGRPLHFIAQIQDISARQQAQSELERTHEELLAASRRGGMAEVATNVLHNVGNVVYSVNVSANLVADSVKISKVGNLAKAAALLRAHESDLGAFMTGDARGRQLPAYLARLADHLVADQDATVKELELLRANIDHIKEIVAMQQSHAKMSGVAEIVKVTDLVEDSLRMNSGPLTRQGVEIIREFEDVPPINIEKHKVLQILVNLVRNAKHACCDSGRADKQMTLRVAHGGIGIRASVTDNGVGILPENLTRIFNHGFTTRKAGHGFGLHSGALAAREMGGSLNAYSDGLGKGATFILELPIHAASLAA